MTKPRWGSPLRYLPEWLLSLEEGPRRLELLNQLAQDQWTMTPGEVVRCWFCYRGSFKVWDHAIACVGGGSCHTYYLLQPGTRQHDAHTKKSCAGCHTGCFKVRSGSVKCGRCGLVDDFRLFQQMVALLLPDRRAFLRQQGDLLPGGGPSWAKTKLTKPWRPRVDMSPRRLANRLRMYDRMQDQKREKGRDVNLDYRRIRDAAW